MYVVQYGSRQALLTNKKDNIFYKKVLTSELLSSIMYSRDEGRDLKQKKRRTKQ